MTVIAPCITVETADEYRAQVERLLPFASRVHIDISDGIFTPTKLLSENEVYWPPEWQVDVHVMAAKPSEHLAKIVSLKPNLIIIHAECNEDPSTLLKAIKRTGIKAGIALQKQTVPLTVADAIKIADHVMIFSGELGKYGGHASVLQVEKTRLIKGINPTAEIGWDGGASFENVHLLAKSGITVINSGGAIAQSKDPQVMFTQMTQEANRQGVL